MNQACHNRERRRRGSMASMIGRLHHLIMDCADPAGHPFCLIPRPDWAPPIPS